MAKTNTADRLAPVKRERTTDRRQKTENVTDSTIWNFARAEEVKLASVNR